MPQAQAYESQQQVNDPDYEGSSESNKHIFKRPSGSRGQNGGDTSKEGKVWCRVCKDFEVTKKHMKSHVMTKHSQEYLKTPNVPLDYWMSYACYMPTKRGNNSCSSKNEDSDD